jgi:hypothetical protein
MGYTKDEVYKKTNRMIFFIDGTILQPKDNTV